MFRQVVVGSKRTRGAVMPSRSPGSSWQETERSRSLMSTRVIHTFTAASARRTTRPSASGRSNCSREPARRVASRQTCACAKPIPWDRGLHELCETIGADLLVVGSSRPGLLGRVLLGDDTCAALNGSPCAIAVAPAGYVAEPAAMREIGVGYDGSSESAHALQFGRTLALELGAKLRHSRRSRSRALP